MSSHNIDAATNADQHASRERFYDDQIAPKLADLAHKCSEMGMSFVAAVEYNRDDVGETAIIQANAGIAVRLTGMAVRANGNVDALVLGISRYSEKNGHSSIFMANIGIPVGPGQGAYRYQKTRDRLIESARRRGLLEELMARARFLCARPEIQKIEDLTPMETEAMLAVIEQHPLLVSEQVIEDRGPR